MVVDDNAGVVKLVFEVAKAVPPEAEAYQSMVSPAPGVAVSVSIPVPHLAEPVATGTPGHWANTTAGEKIMIIIVVIRTEGIESFFNSFPVAYRENTFFIFLHGWKPLRRG